MKIKRVKISPIEETKGAIVDSLDAVVDETTNAYSMRLMQEQIDKQLGDINSILATLTTVE